MSMRSFCRIIVALLVAWNVVMAALASHAKKPSELFCIRAILFEVQLDTPEDSGQKFVIISFNKSTENSVEIEEIFPQEVVAKIGHIKKNFEYKYKGECLPRDKVIEIANKLCEEITQAYLEYKYITTRAKLVKVTNELIRIQILEGKLSEIEIENKDELWLRESFIKNRIRLGAKKEDPLNFDRLEGQLRLLRMDPSIDHIEPSLKPTGEPGKSNLSVRVKEALPIYIKFGMDNYSPPSIGSERFGVDFKVRNPTRAGDQLAGSYYLTTTGGGELIDVNYMRPLNAMNGTIMARGARYWTKITDSEFEDLGLDGERVLYEVKYRQPLIREYSHEFALSLGFTFIDGTTFVFENIGTPFGIGPDEDGVSRTSVVKLTQDFTQRGAERVWYLQSQINIGMDLFNATKNPNPIPDGRFVSWIGQGYIGQRIDKRQVLIIQGALQLSDDGLLASEQFVIGGAQSVRGYRQNMRIGDNGFRFSIEDRVSLVRDKAGNSIFDIRPFIDMGATWNVSDNPNEQQDKRFLLGAGVGVWASLGSLWEPLRDLWVRLDYGYPIIKMDDRGSNLQDKGFYFSINYEPNKILEKLF